MNKNQTAGVWYHLLFFCKTKTHETCWWHIPCPACPVTLHLRNIPGWTRWVQGPMGSIEALPTNGEFLKKVDVAVHICFHWCIATPYCFKKDTLVIFAMLPEGKYMNIAIKPPLKHHRVPMNNSHSITRPHPQMPSNSWPNVATSGSSGSTARRHFLGGKHVKQPGTRGGSKWSWHHMCIYIYIKQLRYISYEYEVYIYIYDYI